MTILHMILNHLLAIGAVAWFVTSCAVMTMPAPNIPWDGQAYKTWFYDFSHMVVVTKNTRLAANPIPQAPLSAPAVIPGINGAPVPDAPVLPFPKPAPPPPKLPLMSKAA